MNSAAAGGNDIAVFYPGEAAHASVRLYCSENVDTVDIACETFEWSHSCQKAEYLYVDQVGRFPW